MEWGYLPLGWGVAQSIPEKLWKEHRSHLIQSYLGLWHSNTFNGVTLTWLVKSLLLKIHLKYRRGDPWKPQLLFLKDSWIHWQKPVLLKFQDGIKMLPGYSHIFTLTSAPFDGFQLPKGTLLARHTSIFCQLWLWGTDTMDQVLKFLFKKNKWCWNSGPEDL